MEMKIKEIEKYLVPVPKIISYDSTVSDIDFEKGNVVNFSVCGETVGSKRVVMGRTVVPAHSWSKRHFHAKAEACIYIVSGTLVAYLGPKAERRVLPAGTFMFIPEGVIHGGANPSDEEVVLIFTYGGVSSKEEAGIIQVIEDDGIYPPANWDDSETLKL